VHDPFNIEKSIVIYLILRLYVRIFFSQHMRRT